MERHEILTKIRPVFSDIFDVDEDMVNEDTTSEDIPGWDSLNHIVLIASLENEFSIRFSLDDYAEMKKVQDIMNYIEAQL